MKKIIIYGIENVMLRRNIEFFLDDDYEIIGYSDSNYTNDVIDGKTFINSQQLLNYQFDYILLSGYTEDMRANMRTNLLHQNIPPQKIIELKLLVPPLDLSIPFESLDLIADIRDYYQGECGLIFGLSYSICGILKRVLKVPYYDCTVSGLDLYYNFQIYMYMKKMGFLSKVERVLLVFPYYYFNWDMSRGIGRYKKWKMCALRQLDDYHNYRDLRGGVDDYIVNYRMFGRKFAQFYRSHTFNFQTLKVYEGIDGMGQLDEKRFYDRHEKTIEENKSIFLNFIREIYTQGIEPVLIIPPIYLNGLDQISKDAVNEKKILFYQIIRNTEQKTQKKIKIFDYVDVFADQRKFFRDLTHLNTPGAEEFTKLINQNIL